MGRLKLHIGCWSNIHVVFGRWYNSLGKPSVKKYLGKKKRDVNPAADQTC